MRIFWMVVFILLFLSQLLAFFSAGSPSRPLGPVVSPPDAGLTELSEQTSKFWNDIVASSFPGSGEFAPSGQASVLDREQLMLRLRDTESALSGPESRVRISSELEAWIDNSSERDASKANGADVFPYMTGLLAWLESFPVKDERIIMERSFITPESTSDFPCLSFELSGSVSELGAFLLAFENRHRRWILKELDMNRGDSSVWWFRGSYAFGGDGL